MLEHLSDPAILLSPAYEILATNRRYLERYGEPPRGESRSAAAAAHRPAARRVGAQVQRCCHDHSRRPPACRRGRGRAAGSVRAVATLKFDGVFACLF